MKKLFLLAAISVLFSLSSQAQYRKGEFLLNAGIGLGYYHAGGVPLMVSGEYLFTDKLSIGPYLSYTSYSWRSGYRNSFVDTGLRGTYHFSELIGIREKKLDIYGGGFIGYVFSSYSYDNNIYRNDPYGSEVRFGIVAGARYFFSEKVGGYAEVGAGYVPLAVGVTFRF